MTFNKISDNQKIKFVDSFMEHLKNYPFGSMPVRDMNCLLLYLFRENGFIPTDSNESTCDALGINQTKLKSFLVDARYKYGKNNRAENVRSIIKDLSENKVKAQYKNDSFIFFIEDPVKRLDFEQEMKGRGYYIDSSFNSEIVKISATAMFDFLSFYDNTKKHKAFIELVKSSKDVEQSVLDLIDTKKAWIDYAKDLAAIVENHGGDWKNLLASVAGYTCKHFLSVKNASDLKTKK